MANTVTLTFAGDSKGATTAFSQVGESSRKMNAEVDRTSDAWSSAGEAADGAEGKARGFADTLTGTADVAAGFGEVMKGDVFGGLVMVGTGVADLAGGLANFLIPALAKTRVGILAKAAADRVAAAGARAWALGQSLLNVSLLASPLTWIVIGIGLVVAAIILIASKTDWFKRAWTATWTTVKTAANNVWTWLRKLPDQLAGVFADVTDAISGPFISAFNYIADAWNSTVGALEWTVPSWVPGIGGNTIGAPDLPHFHAGGVVPGVAGTPVPILALAGERVSSPAGAAGASITIGSDGTRLGDALVDLIAVAMKGRGGDPAALGIVR